jgi:hypothetical protein
MEATVTKRLPLWDRLESQREIDKISGCWLWTGNRDKSGYGYISQVWVEGRRSPIAVHRLVAHLKLGLDLSRPEIFACHRCDNPPCFNPDHLFVGTAKDNQADRSRKGRGNFGERNGQRKLKNEDVFEIRRRASGGETQLSIAGRFTIDQSLVSLIVNRRSWAHI